MCVFAEFLPHGVSPLLMTLWSSITLSSSDLWSIAVCTLLPTLMQISLIFFHFSWWLQYRMTTGCKCCNPAPPTFLSASFWRPSLPRHDHWPLFFFLWVSLSPPHTQSHTSQLRRLISRSITELPGICPDHTNAGKWSRWGHADLPMHTESGGGGSVRQWAKQKKNVLNVD